MMLYGGIGPVIPKLCVAKKIYCVAKTVKISIFQTVKKILFKLAQFFFNKSVTALLLLGELELYAYHTRLKIDQQKQSSYNFIKKN
jgi:hypothetical protein